MGLINEKKFEFYETSTTLLWFLMDGLWMMGFKILSAIIALPAVIAACLVLIYASKTPHLLAIVAGSTWLFMDICWMIGENFKINWLHMTSKVMFWITFLFLVYGLTKSRNYRESVFEVLSGFRRFKIKNE